MCHARTMLVWGHMNRKDKYLIERIAWELGKGDKDRKCRYKCNEGYMCCLLCDRLNLDDLDCTDANHTPCGAIKKGLIISPYGCPGLGATVAS